MPVTRANVDYFWSIARPRNRKPYGYGGVWSRNDVNRTTDCSGIVTHALDAVINGDKMSWSRHGISTESYRYVGGPGSKGPFGTIRVARPGDIPADAVVKIGLMHGPGGGANSHMACTIEGIAVESRGGSVAGGGGQWIGGNGRHYNNSLFHDWFYLPGSAGPVAPRPPGAIYLGEDCAQYECVGDRVLALQRKLNADYEAYSALELDGEYGPLTAAVVREFQRRSGLTADGIAGPATLAVLNLFTSTTEVPPVALTDSQKLDQILKDTTEIRKQLETAGDPTWKARKRSLRDLLNDVADKVGVPRA